MKPYLVPELAQKYGYHDMIESHTQLPDFPDLRVRLLFSFLNEQRFAAKYSELYALTVALVQQGLDTHEMVDNEQGLIKTQEMRSRQLRILAGDFFSSRFYQLLAQAGQIDMVKRISEAIVEVNRLKAELYIAIKQGSVTADNYLTQRSRLKAELFVRFEELLEDRFVKSWRELLETISQLETIQEELELDMEKFAGSWGYWHIRQAGTLEEQRLLTEHRSERSFIGPLLLKYDIKGQLNRMLLEVVEQLHGQIEQLESDKLAALLSQLKEQVYSLSAFPTMNKMR